jgi:quercetin 2,3-dioxygenase
MITKRPSSERGHFNHGWLDTHHSFSFGHYIDRDHMSFGTLRVINEDRVEPGMGFGTHPHDNMEIVTYIVSGALEHKDSLGNGEMIRPGEIQRMTAGTGVTHSEFNPSTKDPVHLLQIWIRPAQRGLDPGYEQKAIASNGPLTLIASPEGGGTAVRVHQDARLYRGLLPGGERITHALGQGRGAWVQVIEGRLNLNGETLEAGDGAAIEQEDALEFAAQTDAHFLLFDLG